MVGERWRDGGGALGDVSEAAGVQERSLRGR